MATPYRDRIEAGRLLAEKLERYAHRSDVIVLALPRGGVPVAYEVARNLGAPLDVFLVRKLGVPGQEELAMGAIATGGIRLLNNAVVTTLRIPRASIEAVAAAEERELAHREREYHGDHPPIAVRDRTAILVDDGLATGSTMRSAVVALRRRHPRAIVVAVPVAARSTCEELRAEVDEIVCGRTPEGFSAVGAWYEDFSETTDREVRDLLEQSRHDRAASASAS
jgi:predicted phosphoribosyltransferase